MATLLDLATRLEKKAKEVDNMANQRAIDVAISILSQLMDLTPVYTTKALSNWQVSLGSPVTSAIEAYYPGFLGYTHGPSSKAAMSVARNVLKNKQPGVTIYISNLVPYIVNLNNGSSKQAPAGFVESAVIIGRKI